MTFRELVLVEKPVIINSSRSPVDAEISLNEAASGKTAMFTGSVRDGKGSLRMKGFITISARGLTFRILPHTDGSLLQGRLRPTLWLRVYRAFAGAMFAFFFVSSLVRSIRGEAPIPDTLVGLGVAIIFGGFFIIGYTWLTTLFTRRTERTLLKAVEYVLRDDASAKVALDLLSSSR